MAALRLQQAHEHAPERDLAEASRRGPGNGFAPHLPIFATRRTPRNRAFDIPFDALLSRRASTSAREHEERNGGRRDRRTRRGAGAAREVRGQPHGPTGRRPGSRERADDPALGRRPGRPQSRSISTPTSRKETRFGGIGRARRPCSRYLDDGTAPKIEGIAQRGWLRRRDRPGDNPISGARRGRDTPAPWPRTPSSSSNATCGPEIVSNPDDRAGVHLPASRRTALGFGLLRHLDDDLCGPARGRS